MGSCVMCSCVMGSCVMGSCVMGSFVMGSCIIGSCPINPPAYLTINFNLIPLSEYSEKNLFSQDSRVNKSPPST